MKMASVVPTTPMHKFKLHVINIHYIAHDNFMVPLTHIQFQTAIVSSVNSFTFPLDKLKIKLSSHSLGIIFLRTMRFVRSAISSLHISGDVFSISVTTPEGQEALPFFMLQIDFYHHLLSDKKSGPCYCINS